MDHESLSDMGMASLGHRLKLLRAVWEVKRDQGMELSLDDWQPQDVPELGPERMEAERLLETVTELRECPLSCSMPPRKSRTVSWKRLQGIHLPL